jgi:lipopolysaccharide export LptBFGC system permease protein LptF
MALGRPLSVLDLLRRAFGTLDAYVLRRFAVLYAATLASFTLIFVLVDLVGNLDEFSRESGSLAELARLLVRYYGVNLPIVFCQILGPIACLTAGLFTTTLFQRANELVPVLSSGRSFRRMSAPMVAAAIAIALGTFAVQELWIPRTRDVFREVSGARGAKLETRDQKYLDAGRDLLIVIRRYLIREQRAEGVLVLPTNPRRVGDSVISARAMEWVVPEGGPGYWSMRDGFVQSYRPLEGSGRSRLVPAAPPARSGGPPALSETFAERRLDTHLIPEDLEVREGEVIHMTLADLRRKMRDSREAGWTIKYYARFFNAANNVILLLLGLPVIVFFGTRNIFLGAVIAAAVAASFFVVVVFVQELGAQGVLPAPLGAALGPLFFLALAVSWLEHVRT